MTKGLVRLLLGPQLLLCSLPALCAERGEDRAKSARLTRSANARDKSSAHQLLFSGFDSEFIFKFSLLLVIGYVFQYMSAALLHFKIKFFQLPYRYYQSLYSEFAIDLSIKSMD